MLKLCGSAILVSHAFPRQVHHVLIACWQLPSIQAWYARLYDVKFCHNRWQLANRLVPNSEVVICTFCYALLFICVNECFRSVKHVQSRTRCHILYSVELEIDLLLVLNFVSVNVKGAATQNVHLL